MALGVVGMVLLTRLTPASSYATGVLPGLLVIGVGMGSIFGPAFSAATLGVAPNEAGIASGMVNTAQQVGGSIGTSLLCNDLRDRSRQLPHQPPPRPRPHPPPRRSRRHDRVRSAAGTGPASCWRQLPPIQRPDGGTTTALARHAIANSDYNEPKKPRPPQTTRARRARFGAVGHACRPRRPAIRKLTGRESREGGQPSGLRAPGVQLPSAFGHRRPPPALTIRPRRGGVVSAASGVLVGSFAPLIEARLLRRVVASRP